MTEKEYAKFSKELEQVNQSINQFQNKIDFTKEVLKHLTDSDCYRISVTFSYPSKDRKDGYNFDKDLELAEFLKAKLQKEINRDEALLGAARNIKTEMLNSLVSDYKG